MDVVFSPDQNRRTYSGNRISDKLTKHIEQDRQAVIYTDRLSVDRLSVMSGVTPPPSRRHDYLKLRGEKRKQKPTKIFR